VDTFPSKASLKTAVTEFYSNAALAIEKYGPIANWCVSAITDMSELFRGLTNFNAYISGWDTSSVTDMRSMFQVRSARALGPQALSRAFSPCMPLVCRHHTTGPPAFRLAPFPPASHALPSTRQGASAFNQPLSWDISNVKDMSWLFGGLTSFNADISGWDTSSVTTMRAMFYVRSPRVPLAPKP